MHHTDPSAPEKTIVTTSRVSCAGDSDHGIATLGHPRVFLEIDADKGYVDCGYCDRRFVLQGGVYDTHQGRVSA